MNNCLEFYILLFGIIFVLLIMGICSCVTKRTLSGYLIGLIVLISLLFISAILSGRFSESELQSWGSHLFWIFLILSISLSIVSGCLIAKDDNKTEENSVDFTKLEERWNALYPAPDDSNVLT